MAIPLATKWQIALGKETDFSKRVLTQLHREAVYRLPSATDQNLLACRSIWSAVSQYEFPLTLAILNDQFVGVADTTALNALPDTGVNSVEAAIGAQWNTFVSVFFPSN